MYTTTPSYPCVFRYEAECMVKGEHTFLLLVLLYRPGVSSAGDDRDVFKVRSRGGEEEEGGSSDV